jgi:hypothetical protein
MKMLPINNVQSKPQFKAKFSKQDLCEFLREMENNDVDMVSKLYTMLDVIKKQSGKEAKIEHLGLWHRILIDGKSVTGDNKYFCAWHALIDATVKAKNSKVKEVTQVNRLAEEEFENACYKNSKKTKQDIENMFEG